MTATVHAEQSLIQSARSVTAGPIVVETHEDREAIVERIAIARDLDRRIEAYYKPMRESTRAAWKAVLDAEKDVRGPIAAFIRQAQAALDAWHERAEENARRMSAAVAEMVESLPPEARTLAILPSTATAPVRGEVRTRRATIDVDVLELCRGIVSGETPVECVAPVMPTIRARLKAGETIRGVTTGTTSRTHVRR